MGYVPHPPPPRLNVDRFGLPKDYATYEWLLYGKVIDDRSPQRLALAQPTPPWPQRASTIVPERR